MSTSELAPRWLDSEAVAAHVSIRPDYVARYVRAGKLPPPCHPFGVRQPRWDRVALDQWMAGTPTSTGPHTAIQGLADEIARAGRRNTHRP